MEELSDLSLRQGQTVSPKIQDTETHLTRPDGRDDEAVVLEDVEDLDDASGVSKDGDAGVGHGEVKGQVVGGLQGRPLSVEDEQNHRVPQPGQPAWRTTKTCSGTGDSSRPGPTETHTWTHTHT